MVEGALKPYALSKEMEKCSLAQCWKLAGKIRAEKVTSAMREEGGSLRPRQLRLSPQLCWGGERKQS